MAVSYIKKGNDGWKVFFPEGITGTGFSATGLQSLEEGASLESAHTKDANGNDALSVYFNKSRTISLTACYEGTTAPTVGDDLTINSVAYVITSASVSYNNGGTAAMVNISAESRDAWTATA